MKVSIITACYNSAATIEKTIESVRAQKKQYDDMEYIVVDGASSDGTKELILQNLDVIDRWISARDKGISDAFNKGIAMASGELICLLNADDELLPNAVAQVAGSINDEVDVIHGNIISRDEKGFCKVKKPNCDYALLMTKGMYLNHPGMFIRKRAYEKWGDYNLTYRCGMDRELLARFTAGGAVFQYIDMELVLFQCGGESTRNYIRHGIPENKRTSLSYGVPRWKVEAECFMKEVLFIGSMIKRRLIWLLGRRA